MKENIKYIKSNKSNNLYIILSGISGGKDEAFTKNLSDLLLPYGSILSMQFCNDPDYHNFNLQEMKDMSFEKCFDILNFAIDDSENSQYSDKLVFIAHSFSALIATYYLQNINVTGNINKKYKYKLFLIDNSASKEIVTYFKSAKPEEIFLGDSVIKYMTENDSEDALKDIGVEYLKISAEELNADHNFEDKDALKKLVSKIIAS